MYFIDSLILTYHKFVIETKSLLNKMNSINVNEKSFLSKIHVIHPGNKFL